MVYTSNYASLAKLPEDALKIRISVTQPLWATTDGTLSVLYPNAKMLWEYKDGRIGDAEYTRRYTQALDKNEPAIKSAISALKEKAAGRDIVLLCWCARGAFCHRRIFAGWYERKTGEKIPEYIDTPKPGR